MDAVAYSRAETLAGQVMSSWRIGQAHFPAAFARVGFPMRVESSADLFQLLDTMNETRFRLYQEELGGLTETDVSVISSALASHCRFVGHAFHAERAALPLDTMLASYALYTKVTGWAAHRSILEIGPGCGYLSYLLGQTLGDDWEPVFDRYDQIESTQSFYLLQNLVNDHCFGNRHVEHAALEPYETRDRVCPKMAHEELMVDVPTSAACNHFPWWKLGEIASTKYDVITANACLNELSPQALEQYADLIATVLNDEGCLIAQCFGGGPTPSDVILETLGSRGLVPMVLADAPHPNKRWAVPNALWTHQRHPGVRGRGVSVSVRMWSDPLPSTVYGIRPGARRVYGASEFVERVSARLAS